jgi:hypothetical protein
MLRRVKIFEPHRYRHIVGPIRVDPIADGVAEVRSNLIAVPPIVHNGKRASSSRDAISTAST